MPDDTINIVFALLIFFGLMGVLRGRGLGMRTRDLQRQVAELQMARAAAPAVLAGASKEHVQRLEDRVRVLERIVTDNGYTLASQIEALRDRDAAELERND